MARRFVKVYPRFERLWHWTQMVMIMILMFTGFGLNGLHSLLPFGPAVMLHTLAALVLLAIWIFATFWLFTTGTWRQFIPQIEGLFKMARFYAYGVFRGEEPPYQKIFWRKHNPLQALTYFGLKVVVFPAIWGSGLLYLTYNFWAADEGSTFMLYVIANVHLLAAYVIAAFVVIHVYLLTVGHGFRAHVRPMVTGYDCIDLTSEQEAYLETNEPGRLMPKKG
ncbi:cytochrome b/b6 domain-containing protein [Aliiroseovarius sediminis]|uniref:cytochrome b/b6 domain-containing protein n=1 Tax=Aliiroseovarius sediminis TaxID=2925839 RepID=UPI001F5ACEE5|nr:cytochrome b/b6 domain-containing protein [Aliiroseovarius sediminis]MCI2393188.1 cytochrome b/b6 domain-containing protein [Aliiroseovarius sediminis]